VSKRWGQVSQKLHAVRWQAHIAFSNGKIAKITKNAAGLIFRWIISISTPRV